MSADHEDDVVAPGPRRLESVGLHFRDVIRSRIEGEHVHSVRLEVGLEVHVPPFDPEREVARHGIRAVDHLLDDQLRLWRRSGGVFVIVQTGTTDCGDASTMFVHPENVVL